MKDILGGSVIWRRRTRGQLGFTLVEMLIALVIGGLVLVGSAGILRYMVVNTAGRTDQTMAKLQVQYVGFWISEDVVQAQSISLGNSTVDGYTIIGFPFVLGWTGPSGNTTVTYQVEGMEDKLGRTLLQLYRSRDGGNIMVAEYLDPGSTTCKLEPVGNNTYKLRLEVVAKVDQKEASGVYEINPRTYDGS